LRAACAIDCLPSCSMDRLHPQDKEVKKTDESLFGELSDGKVLEDQNYDLEPMQRSIPLV
jgi:hypothetical protein